MKLNLIKKSVIPALVAVLSLSSCLKENNPNLDFDAVSGKAYVGIADASPSSSTYNATSVAVVSSAAETTVNLNLSYLSNNSNPGTSVTLKVETDKAIIDKYNTARGTNYKQLDPANYSLPTTQINIPAGQKTAPLPVLIKPKTIADATSVYALPIVVTNASGAEISGNYGVHMILVSIKNPLDGNYEVTATAPMVDVVAPNLSGFYPLNSDLVTVTPNSVVMFCYTYLNGLEGHPIKNGNASSYYGNFAPVFHFDDDGNITSVTNHYDGNPANTLPRSARLDPSGVNKFTVSGDGTKTLEVSYIMTQGGSDRTFFHEKWTFVEER